MSGHPITLDEVLEIAKECKIEFKPGDIFFLRCGFTKTWESISLDEKKAYRASTQAHKHRHTGLMQSEAAARFVWDNHIVAVAGDGVSFEVSLTRPFSSENISLKAFARSDQLGTTTGRCTTTAWRDGACQSARCSIWSDWRHCARS